ncbi:tumor necrosis factor receptor-like protein [Lymphocystis disease virus 3]|uniref:Tumor necrosis factor receptor-like protein n=1 Tax=Lymphocystis disease virus 3 TaxID=2560566 RepID=A0A1B2RVY0_9VIRU|nr:tumor necrosis factor receptor-like protein [Lymphocystis disease virus Sa]AOC55160.1 tumor necrosis factor receptor-like protein [Lymphocystis disease virus 3]
MSRGYSQRCQDLTQKWDQGSGSCTPCTLPGAGKQINPNCGWDDAGGRHDIPASKCPPRQFNDGKSYYCTPCSSCTSGYTSTPCTTTKDTECHKIVTVAPITTTLPPTTTTLPPTQFPIPIVSNQTLTTTVTVTSQYPSSFITHTIPISAGTFWGLAALFMLLKQSRSVRTEPFHCGGDGGFSDNVLMIASDFSASTNCTFALLMNDNSSTIGVTLKQMDLSDDCNQEYVELFDGSESKSLGKFCGKEIPPPITTTGSILLINFISLSSSHGSGGFLGHYYQIK